MSRDHLVPEFLQGSHRQVIKATRQLLRRAVELGSIGRAVANERMSSIQELGGLLVLDGDQRCPSIGNTNILLYPVRYELLDITAEGLGDDFTRGSNIRSSWINLVESLTFPSLGDFWFSLSCIAGQGDLPPLRFDAQADRKAALTMLRGLLRWWPDFISLRDRFSVAGLPPDGSYEDRYMWAGTFWELAKILGSEPDELREMRSCSESAVCDWLLGLAVSG